MRRKWVWDPAVNDLVEVPTDYSQPVGESAMIMPDIPDFVSTVDGSVIHGRAGLRVHNARHGVTNAADFTNEWKAAAAKRAEVFTGSPRFDQRERKQAVIDAFNKHRRT